MIKPNQNNRIALINTLFEAQTKSTHRESLQLVLHGITCHSSSSSMQRLPGLLYSPGTLPPRCWIKPFFDPEME